MKANEFKKYWDKKSQKRRKSWAAKAKRFAEQHTQLEDIRKEVYLPLDFGANFSFEDYKPEHFIKLNPITSWQDKNFCFSEEGLRAALKAEGADMNSFRMSVSRQPIKGLEAPQPENKWEAYEWKPNKVYDYDRMFRSWLQRIYEICTDVETVSLSYRQITMTIKRYSTEGMPFGYYELNPCEQLTKSAMLMQETDFYTLNVATLLMEAAAEWDLRQEELNYYAKKLRIRTMDAALTDDISFELWDDKKLEKKIAEYVSKDYPVEKIIEQVLRPWKQAITKYFRDITEQELNNSIEKFNIFELKHNHAHSSQYIKDVLQPFFCKHGLRGVKMWIPEEGTSPLYMESQGYQAKYDSWNDAFYPNAHYSMCCIYGELNKSPLRALSYFLQKMLGICKKTDEVVIKVMHLYDGLMLQKHEAYRKNVEYLDSLAAQHKGTPVGRMMKFLRWNAGRFGSRLSVSSVKVLGETSFSFLERTTLMAGNQPLLHEEEVKERWIDTDCQNLYAADPVTTDFDKWVKTHGKGMRIPWKWPVQVFLRQYSTRDSKPSLSIDFIEQKL